MPQTPLKDFIRQRFDCRAFLKKSSGCSLYICPNCGSGSGQHKTGAVQYYPDTQRWYCHKCRTLGDIFTIYELEHGVDFNAALRALAEQLGTAVEPYSTKPARKCPPAPSPVQSGSAPKDLSDYFAACRARLYDPAAIAYLAERGISPETAVAYGLGFDPKADPAGSHRCCPRIIIPTNCFHYVARSIDPDAQPGCRMMNNLGATPDLFNRQALYAPGNEPVFVTEGAFDALSIIEAGGSAIALNSASNGRLLLTALQERPTNHPLLLCLDNDETGLVACANLSEQLHDLDADFRDVCIAVCGETKDPNEAFQADKPRFIESVQGLKAETMRRE